MADDIKVVIFEKAYPFPLDYKPLDAVLIYELTGMELDEYFDTIDSPDSPKAARATPGLLGVTLSRAYPKWSRGHTAEQVQRISAEDWRIEGGEEQELGQGDAAVVPPPVAASESTVSTPQSSSDEPDGRSEPSTL